MRPWDKSGFHVSQFSSSDDQPLEEQDVRDLIRPPRRVIAAKADQTGKRRLIMEGLCQLIGADAWAWSLLHMKLGSAPRQVVFLHEGISDDRLPHYLCCLEHEDLQWIRNRLVVDAVTRHQPLTRQERQLFTEWPEESIAFRTRVAKAKLRSFILMAWPKVTGGFSGIGIYRNADRPPFGSRESRIAHIVLSGIPWLHEQGWGEERADSLVNLSKRPREILGLLVQGRARKQLADDLGLSIHTVHGTRFMWDDDGDLLRVSDIG